jgi:hypothetical protein
MSASNGVPLSSMSQLVNPSVMNPTYAINVNIQDTVTMAKTLTTDSGRFTLQNNVYNQNFAGRTNAIVSLYSIRNLYMNNESFTNNEWNYEEALVYYGEFASADSFYSIEKYFTTDGSGIRDSVNDYDIASYYPSAVLSLSSITYIHMVSVTFDNNAFAETTSLTQQATYG